MITLEKYRELSKVYNEMVDKADAELKAVITGNKNEMGLVNSETKNSYEYKKAKKAYDTAFSLLRNFASTVPNKIKREAAMLNRAEKIKANQTK